MTSAEAVEPRIKTSAHRAKASARPASGQGKSRSLVRFLRKMLRTIADFFSRKRRDISLDCKVDVRAKSPRKLYRELHEFLEENGFEHDYTPLVAERDAINDIAIFNSELVAKRDVRGRDLFNLVFGILLLLTVVLAPIAIVLLERSRYTLRTVARVSFEGEAYRAKATPQAGPYSEIVDLVSDVKVRWHLHTGIADDDRDISHSTRCRPEARRATREQKEFGTGIEWFLLERGLASL